MTRDEDATIEDRGAIAARVIDVARRRLDALRGLQRADRDDAVQQTVANVLEAVDTGAVTQLDAFTRRVAYHCGIDAIRRRQRAARQSPGAAGDPGDGERSVESIAGPESDAAPSPESLVAEKARRLSITHRSNAIWDLVEQAPDNYRRVLEQKYRLGRSLEDLARDELDRRVSEGTIAPERASDPAEFQRALSTVHAWHSRALKWLQQRASDEWREVL